MKTITSLLLTCCLAAAQPAFSGEVRFAAMVADVESGLILTADRIDAPRDPALMGRLSVLALAIQGLSDGSLSKDELLQVRVGSVMSVSDALRLTALGDPGFRAPMTALVNRVGKSPRVMEQRLGDLADLAGLQATAIRVVRGEDGGPDFEGYSTSRDISRLAASLLRAFPQDVRDIFSAATGHISTTDLWLYENGECLISARAPSTGRRLTVLMTGAPDQATCLEKSAHLITRDDVRIRQAAGTAPLAP